MGRSGRRLALVLALALLAVLVWWVGPTTADRPAAGPAAVGQPTAPGRPTAAPGAVDPRATALTAPTGRGSPTPGVAPVAARTPRPTPPPSPTALGRPPAAAPKASSTASPDPAGSPTPEEPGDGPTPEALPTPEEPVGTPTPVARRLVGPRAVPTATRFEPVPLVPDANLAARIGAQLGDRSADYAVVVKRLADGRGVAIDADRQFYAASLFKLFVMYEVFKQRELGLLAFEDALTVTPPYLEYQLGPPRWPVWTDVPIRDLLEAMITESDNVAAMLLYDRVGPWNLQRDLVAIGLERTDVATNDLPTSAGDLALFLEMIARGQTVDPAVSAEMVELLGRQKVHDRLPALLPPDVTVAHKTGNWDDVTHDAGIVYAPSGPYLIVVLSARGWEPRPIAELSRLVYDYFEGAPR